MAIKIPDADDLGQPALKGANTPAQIDTRSANAIGAGGKAIGDGIAGLGGALGDLVGRIEATRKSQADSDFDLQMTADYYRMQQEASLKAGSLGEGLTEFPGAIDKHANELADKYGLDDKQRRAKREQWAKTSTPWAYHSAQTRAQAGFINQFDEATNNVARFVQENPDAYDQQMEILDRKAADGDGKFWDQSVAEVKKRTAKKVVTDAYLRGLAEKYPDRVLDAIGELRGKGIDVDGSGLDGGPYKGPGLGGKGQEAIKYRDLPPASTSGINRGPRTSAIEGVVVHHTAGSSVDGAITHGNSSRTGANYYVDRDGTVIRAVPEGDRTAHIREPGTPYRNGSHPNLTNGNTVGIEVVAKSDADVTPAQRQAVAGLVADIARRNNIKADNIVGHGEIQGGPGGNREDNEGTAAAQAARQALGGGGAPVQVAEANTGTRTDATGGYAPDISNEPMVRDAKVLEQLSPVARAIGIMPRTNFQQIKRQTGASLEARLNKQMDNAEAQITVTGEQTHITQDDLERARGIVTPAQFEKLQARYRALENKKFERNAEVQMSNMSAEERSSMVRNSIPTDEEARSDQAAARLQQMEVIAKKDADIRKNLATDVAGHVYFRTEAGHSLYQAFNDSVAKNSGPEGVPYREALVERMLDEQTRQGVSGINQRILPAQQAKDIVDRMATIGDRKSAAAFMASLRNSYGKYSGQVMAELALKGAPTSMMVMPFATPQGQDALMEAIAEERRMRELSPDNRTDMVSGKFLGKEGAQIKAETFKQTAEMVSMMGSENGPQAEGIRQAVQYVATKLLRDGKNTSADSAVADAIEMVYGTNLKTIDNPLYTTWRGMGWDKVIVPADVLQKYGGALSTGMSYVPAWLKEHENELVNPFLSPEMQERVAGSAYERWRGSLGNVSFKIADEGDGVYLIDQNGQRVYRGTGSDNGYEPVKFTWDELANLSAQLAPTATPDGPQSGRAKTMKDKYGLPGYFLSGGEDDVLDIRSDPAEGRTNTVTTWAHNRQGDEGKVGVMNGKWLGDIGNMNPDYQPGPEVSKNVEDRRNENEAPLFNPETGNVFMPNKQEDIDILTKYGWRPFGSGITFFDENGKLTDDGREALERQLARRRNKKKK